MTLSLISICFYKGYFQKFKNIWIYIFIGSAFVGMVLSPNFNSILMLAFIQGNEVSLLPNRPISGFWMFKTFSFILLYSMLIIAVASYRFRESQVNNVLRIMVNCAFIMALYIFIQKASLDSFFSIITEKINPDVRYLEQPKLGGFIGQSTLVAPFIAMTIPLALYYKKWTVSAVMCLAVILTQSKMGIGALAVALIAYSLMQKSFVIKVLAVVLIMLAVSFSYSKILSYKSIDSISSGRVGVWADIVKDFVSKPDGKMHTVFGWGAGAFNYAFSIRKDSRFWQAHNEPLEALYNYGLVGVAMIFMFFKKMFTAVSKTPMAIALLCSLLVVLINSLGNFPTQIAPIYLYCLVIIGLLHNRLFTGGEYEAKS